MTTTSIAGRRWPALVLSFLLLAPALAAPQARAAQEPGAPAEGGELPAERRVNVNLAGPAELRVLPQVGPVVAQRIVDYRKAVGPFRQVEELLNVKGIGRKTLERLRPLITLGELDEELPAEGGAASGTR